MKPLVPIELELRDFPYMPMEFGRLFASETWVLSNDAEKVAALTLWGKSWSESPAGSLPSDDRMLAHLSGAGSKWSRLKKMALRGWVACDDGRLYHAVICEKALEAWLEKLSARLSSGAGNAKKWGSAFDPAPIEAQIVAAREALSVLNPASKKLSRKRPPRVPSDERAEPAGNPDGNSAAIPSGVPTGVPAGSQEREKREGEGRESFKSKSSAPSGLMRADSHLSAREREDPSGLPEGTDPEAWALFEAHHEQIGRWTPARRINALGHLRVIVSQGRDPTEVLKWATTRGLADLKDAAERMSADASRAASLPGKGDPEAIHQRNRAVATEWAAEQRAGDPHETR